MSSLLALLTMVTAPVEANTAAIESERLRLGLAGLPLGHFNSQSFCGIGLGVRINDQHPLLQHGQACTQVDCRCGFSNASFLICYRNNFTHRP